jgi:hypothetical protein
VTDAEVQAVFEQHEEGLLTGPPEGRMTVMAI